MTSTTRTDASGHGAKPAAAGPREGAAFFGVCGLLFGASLAITALLHEDMAVMAAVPMSGGWTMPATWTPLCGQTWTGAALHFTGMWAAMMVPMMLPSLAPSLWRYRAALGSPGDAWACTVRLAAAYFFVWTMLGLALYAIGAALGAAAVRWTALAQAMPVLAGAVVLMAGVLQCSAWKARRLACCRQTPAIGPGPCPVAAWRHGLGLGVHCIGSCAGATACLLVLGVMDWRAMAAVTSAITAERLAPDSWRVPGRIGAVTIVAGAWMLARGWRNW